MSSVKKTILLALVFPIAIALPISSAGAAEDDIEIGGSLGVLDPDGSRQGACPLEHTDVRTEISGFVARVIVTQTFSNPFPDPIEAVYTFPLSDSGAVDAMRIRTGDREIRGEVRRREEAREIYENAKRNGQLAALLDQERPNIFTQSITNLMPGATVEIEIQYVETLDYEDGAFEWSFPTVVGPRFIPGAVVGQTGTGREPDTDRVPDASRITPPVAPEGTRAGHDISIAVEIDAGVEILNVDSRLHEIDVERPGPNRAEILLRKRNEIPNRDFVLHYAVAGDRIKSGALTHRSDGDGYVTLILIPPKRVTPQTAAPKELIFVIDRSGSQRGLPLLKAKEAMLWTLQHMNPNDTFQIISFSNGIDKLFGAPQLATPSAVKSARAYIRKLEANGGTMMAEAVRDACATRAEGNRLRIVTLMTDGYIGNDFELIGLVKQLRGNSRWFPFGTGNSVNRFLLEQVARHGGGEVDYVLLNEDGDKVAKKFYDRISSPVLTDLKLEFRGLDVVGVLPYDTHDLWAQKPLIVHARYGRSGRGAVVLRGFRGGEPYEQRIDVALPEVEDRNAAIGSIWARVQVDELMARDLRALQSGNFPDSIKAQIVEVALEHQIMTQFTSFIAVEDRVINENGVSRTVTVAVELPQGVDREGALGDSAELESLRALGYIGGGVSSAYGGAQAASPRSRSVTRYYSGRPAQSLSKKQRNMAAPAMLEEIAAVKPTLSAKQLAKLGPNLRAWVEGHAPAAYTHSTGKKITVRVRLKVNSDATAKLLQDAGLEVSISTDRQIIGMISFEKLAALLAIESVEEVELR
jgi:Ca-activated chloride channel family protein